MMAKELSQAELLDFLCQAGGSVSNAALLGHFKHFLRDSAASPEQLQQRRERFKGFVNSVATVRQEAPGAAKYVVLRKRYRELVGEEAKLPAAGASGASEPPPAPRPPPDAPLGCGQEQGRAGPELASRAPGCGDCRRERPAREERPATCRGPAQERGACPSWPRRCPPAEEPREGLGPRLLPPSSPARSCQVRPSEQRCALLGPAEARYQREDHPRLPLRLWGGGAPPSSARLGLPVGALGAPPREGNSQQRIREWLEKAHADAVTLPCPGVADPLLPRRDEESWPAARPSPPSSAWSTCPSPSLDSQLGPLPAAAAGVWREHPHHVPVFRSIRCQLFLQDLEDFVEQESPASEDSSSASGGSSDSCRLEAGTGALHPAPVRQNGHRRNSVRDAWSGAEGPCCKPQANGLVVPPPARKSLPQRNTAMPECLILLSQDACRSSSSEEPWDKDSRSQSRPLSKVARLPPGRLPPPNLDAPLSPGLVLRQGRLASIPNVEGLGPDSDGSTEQHRSSLVPLEPREHAWLVEVATGSWLQVRALLLTDPHLATRKDFVSGFTVLHWLAKHGNAKALLEVVASVRKGGVTLDVNAKSGCGYTPLHLAAMHGHQLVIKVLVLKLQCRIQVRDCSGKKPWQYLSSATSGEVWQLLGAPWDKTTPARPITRTASSSSALVRNGKSPQLARKISRKVSLAAYLKPQHVKWKMANKYPPLQERAEYSD